MKTVTIDAAKITDWETFHSVFAKALGFFDGYGKNMDAWIDCMGYLDDPSPSLTTVKINFGEVLNLEILHTRDFQRRNPEIFSKLVDCTVSVNWRRVNDGKPPLLSLTFW
jgi:RNAse (barnase) inhibitor barstar